MFTQKENISLARNLAGIFISLTLLPHFSHSATFSDISSIIRGQGIDVLPDGNTYVAVRSLDFAIANDFEFDSSHKLHPDRLRFMKALYLCQKKGFNVPIESSIKTQRLFITPSDEVKAFSHDGEILSGKYLSEGNQRPSKYKHQQDEKVISTLEWMKLPKEERDQFTKTEAGPPFPDEAFTSLKCDWVHDKSKANASIQLQERYSALNTLRMDFSCPTIALGTEPLTSSFINDTGKILNHLGPFSQYEVPRIYNYATSFTSISPRDAIDRLEDSQPTWDSSKFSRPSEHADGRPYQYIVHTVAEPMARMVQTIARIQMAVTSSSEAVSDMSYIDLIETPERISEKPVISTSLMSDKKTGTFGSSGFILDVPPENIHASAPIDMGTPNVFKTTMTDEEKAALLSSIHSQHGLQSPESLLDLTAEGVYNEVVIEGTSPSGTKIKIAAVFYKTDQDGELLEVSPDRMEQLRTLADRLSVPLIAIKEYISDYEDKPLEISNFSYDDSSMITMNKDGIRYILKLKEGKVPEFLLYRRRKTITDPSKLSLFKTSLATDAQTNPTLKRLLEKHGVPLPDA